MCGRATMTLAAEDLAAQLGLPLDALPADYQPRYNIAPTQDSLILREHHEQLDLMVSKWGLVNSWEKDAKNAGKHINARAESLATNRAFREAFSHHRCIVPVDGFYEWSGDRKARQPFWFHRPGGEILRLAGLYEWWQPRPGEWQSTFSIVTTGANGVIGRIHDRMPVILSEEAAGAWIFEGEKEPARLLSLLVPAPDALLVPRAVLPGVNSANAEGAGLLDEAPGVQLSLV